MKKSILLLIIFMGFWPVLINGKIEGMTSTAYGQSVGEEKPFLGLDYNQDCRCYINGELPDVTISALGQNPDLDKAGFAALGLTFVGEVPAGLAVADIAFQEVPGLDILLDGVTLYYMMSSNGNPPAQAAPDIPQAQDLPWQWGVPPGPDWTWKGKTGVAPGSSNQGNWLNNKTGQQLNPDLGHPAPKGPHWGLTQPDGTQWDIFPDGTVEPNN